jgi:hypothetical protein
MMMGQRCPGWAGHQSWGDRLGTERPYVGCEPAFSGRGGVPPLPASVPVLMWRAWRATWCMLERTPTSFHAIQTQSVAHDPNPIDLVQQTQSVLPRPVPNRANRNPKSLIVKFSGGGVSKLDLLSTYCSLITSTYC